MSNQQFDNVVYENIKNTLIQAKNRIYSTINFAMVTAYWNIGKQIFEAQGENKRAEYGTGLIKYLSEKLTTEFGKGFTVTNLKYMRKFYLIFPNSHTLCDQLSWSHYRLLLKIDDDKRRKFYLSECDKCNWSTRQLERQINSFYYERLLKTQNKYKDEVRNEVKKLEPDITPEDILKDPYVLEFLDMKENKKYLENDIEKALINNLQAFLLELGKGFSFISRQKRITIDGDHFYIDLVFYNYILKCFVLIDLKIGKLTHKDIGQMDFYIRYFEKEIKDENDNPTLGIVLCSDKNDVMVKYTILNESKQLFASKYMLYIPTEEELRKELLRERLLIERELKKKEDGEKG